MAKKKYIYQGRTFGTLIKFKGKRHMRLGTIKHGMIVEIVRGEYYLDSTDKSVRPADCPDWESGARVSLLELELLK